MIQAALERKGGRGSGITYLTTTFRKWCERWLPYHPRDRPRRGSGSVVQRRFPIGLPSLVATGSVALAAIRASGGGVPWFCGRIKPVPGEISSGRHDGQGELGIVHRRVRLTPGSQARGDGHPGALGGREAAAPFNPWRRLKRSDGIGCARNLGRFEQAVRAPPD